MFDFKKLTDAIPDDLKEKAKEDIEARLGLSKTGKAPEATASTADDASQSDDAVAQDVSDSDQPAQDDDTSAA